MLHLVDKLYLDVEDVIDYNTHRIVVSQTKGFPLLDSLDHATAGTLCMYARSIDEIYEQDENLKDFSDLINKFIDVTADVDGSVCIYVDRDAYIHFIVNWYKLIFKNPDCDSSAALLRSHLFKMQLFGRSRFSLTASNYANIFNEAKFKSVWDETVDTAIEKKSVFMSAHRSKLSVEFLLATYLKEKQCKDELKQRIKLLVTKDLEKFLYELKELILVHLMRDGFQSAMGFNKTYTFSTLDTAIDDHSPLMRTFFSDKIWKNNGLSSPSSRGTIRLDKFNQADIQNILTITDIATSKWGEDHLYNFSASDMGKLSFIPYIIQPELSDEGLEAILAFETKQTPAAGSFYSLDCETVNNYFVDYLFNNHRSGNYNAMTAYVLA